MSKQDQHTPPPYYPVLFPLSKKENLVKEGVYFEEVLDAVVYFLEQDAADTDKYRLILNSEVGESKLTRKELWTAAFANIFDLSDTAWDPQHDYLVIRTKPRQFGAACILHPYLHEYLKEVFGESYILLPYSIEYVIACPMMPPDAFLYEYRMDLQENPEKYLLSDRLYIVEDGVMTVYPEYPDEDFIPVFIEDPEEKEKKKKREQRRKQNGKQQYLH